MTRAEELAAVGDAARAVIRDAMLLKEKAEADAEALAEALETYLGDLDVRPLAQDSAIEKLHAALARYRGEK